MTDPQTIIYTKATYGDGDSITIFLTNKEAASLNESGFCYRSIHTKEIHLHDKACEAVLS